MNNTFVEQIVESARAAILKASAMGVTDPDRVAVGATVMELHDGQFAGPSRLFRAGIARSALTTAR